MRATGGAGREQLRPAGRSGQQRGAGGRALQAAGGHARRGLGRHDGGQPAGPLHALPGRGQADADPGTTRRGARPHHQHHLTARHGRGAGPLCLRGRQGRPGPDDPPDRRRARPRRDHVQRGGPRQDHDRRAGRPGGRPGLRRVRAVAHPVRAVRRARRRRGGGRVPRLRPGELHQRREPYGRRWVDGLLTGPAGPAPVDPEGGLMTRAPDHAVPFFDIADPAFSVTSAQVRQAREAGWYARTSYGLAVLRYDQVSRLIRHPDLRQGSRLWPAHHGITSGPFADWWASWVLNMEGEEHHRLRRLLNPAFSRRIVEPLRPRFGALAAELVDGFAEPGRCEFMAEFAEPYAARVIAILLGIPEDEWPTIAAESAAVGLAMGVRIREHLPRIEAALAALYDYADALIADRQRSPRDDFVTCLVQAQATDPGRPGGPGELDGPGGVAGAGLTAAELRDSLVLLIF